MKIMKTKINLKQISINLINTFLFLSLIACSSDDEGSDNELVVEAPIALDCQGYSSIPDEHLLLVNNPNAPVDYVVSCKLVINTDVSIEPGTVIAFESDAGFQINGNGSLVSNGTEEMQIVFTGVDKAAGAWAGIYVDSNDIKNSITYTVIEYGGGDKFNSNNDRGNIILYASSQMEVANNTIQYSATNGINMYRGGKALNFENNEFIENDLPILGQVYDVDYIKGSNVFQNNTTNKVKLMLDGHLSENSTWHKLPVPYFTDAGSGTNHVNIDAGLTIEAGTVIEMGEGTQLKVRDNGSLKIEGTANEKVIIRGLVEQPGSWENILYEFTNSVNNSISYAEISHAGNADADGAIQMWASPTLSVSNTLFKDIPTCAFYAEPNTTSPNPNLTTSNITYENVGGQICGD